MSHCGMNHRLYGIVHVASVLSADVKLYFWHLGRYCFDQRHVFAAEVKPQPRALPELRN
jgi:hypothetical protein